MSIYTIPQSNPNRRPAMRGAVMLDISNGKERIRKWPDPRGTNQPQAVIDQRVIFRQASWAAKFLSPEIMVQIMNARVGTPILPRDITMMIFTGTLAWFSQSNGRRYFPLNTLKAVSLSLDTIAQLPGYTLVRGEEYWEAAPYVAGGLPWWFDAPDPAGLTLLSGDATNLVLTYNAVSGLAVDPGALTTADRLRIATTPIPDKTQPWSLVFNIDALLSTVASRNFMFGIRDTITGKMRAVTFNQAGTWILYAIANLTSGGTNGATFAVNQQAKPLFWRLSSDGTFLNFHFSVDCIKWSFIYSENLNAFMVNKPDQVFFGHTYAATASYQSLMNIRKWTFVQ